MENGGSDRDQRPAGLEAAVGASIPLVVAAFALRIGTFPGGAESASVMVALGLAATLAAVGAWRAGLDPLGLQSSRRRVPSQPSRLASRIGLFGLCPFLLVLLVALSREFSPVPRAGLVWPSAILLALLSVPAVACALDRPARRGAARWGLLAALFVVSTWAIVDWLGGSPRPAAPLGHHNLLAAWLVVVWPLALLPGRVVSSQESSGRSGADERIGMLRQVADGAVLAATALALLASRSLAGNVAFGLQLIWVARASSAPGRLRRVVNFGLLGLAMILAVGWRRLGSLFSGGLDQSFASRWDYATAAWSGWWQRPVWGWGPGSSSWTLHLQLEGESLAPGQVVTDAHVLLLDLLYEWGLVSFAFVGLLVLWSFRTRPPATEHAGRDASSWHSASTASLVGLAVVAGCAGFFDVSALWVLIPFVLGCRLAVCPEAQGKTAPPASWNRLAALALLGVALWSILDPFRAHQMQEQARLGVQVISENEARELARRASLLDPTHPQVTMEWARWEWPKPPWGPGDPELAASSVASSLRAAESARGLAPLHLEAGARFAEWVRSAPESTQTDELRPLALRALENACDLAPRDGLAPYLRAMLEEPVVAAELLGFLVRALLAEPRLLVTPELLARPDLRRAAVDRLAAMPMVPLGWRAAVAEAEDALPDLPSPVLDGRRLELVTDGLGETSLSLFAFRRTGEPTTVAAVVVDASRLDFDIPSAFVLPEVRRRGVLPLEDGCRLRSALQAPGAAQPAVLAQGITAPHLPRE